MTDARQQDSRIAQLEDSVLQLQQQLAEARSEIEALGEVLVVTTANLERADREAFLGRLTEAAEAQRVSENERAAKAVETLAGSAELAR